MVEDCKIITSVIDRKKVEKIIKNVEYSNINKLDAMDMYRTKYPRIREYTLFISTHGILTELNHILGQSSSKYYSINILQNTLSARSPKILKAKYKLGILGMSENI